MSNRSSSSRRSSILKAPKCRQPFQDLDFNPSSSENSPNTAKLKRRVSFAEKKHVKKFADHTDKGTIWDLTYEEPDHSSPKLGEDANRDVNSSDLPMTNIQSHSIRNSDTNLISQNKSIANTEHRIPVNLGVMEFPSTEMFPNANLGLICPDEIAPDHGTARDISSQTVYYEDDLDITPAIGGTEQSDENNELAGDDMIFTEVVGPATRRRTHSDVKRTILENQTIFFDNSPMELTIASTAAIQNLVSNANVDERNIEIREEPDSVPFSQHLMAKNNNHCTDNITSDRTIGKSTDETILFNNFNCDLTEAVNVPRNRFDDRENITRKNKTIRFSDFNCELTEAVNARRNECTDRENITRKNKTIRFSDFNCELTEAVNVPRIKRDDRENPTSTNKTIFFNDATCDVTEAVNALRRKSYMPENSGRGNKTILFNDMTCDITRAVNVPLHESNDGQDANRIQQNASVIRFANADFTETRSCETDQAQSVLHSLREPVLMQSSSDHVRTTNINTYVNPESSSYVPRLNDKTILFNDYTCDFTKPVSRPRDESEDGNITRNNKTVRYSDFHCDLTEAINASRNRLDYQESCNPRQENINAVPSRNSDSIQTIDANVAEERCLGTGEYPVLAETLNLSHIDTPKTGPCADNNTSKCRTESINDKTSLVNHSCDVTETFDMPLNKDVEENYANQMQGVDDVSEVTKNLACRGKVRVEVITETRLADEINGHATATSGNNENVKTENVRDVLSHNNVNVTCHDNSIADISMTMAIESFQSHSNPKLENLRPNFSTLSSSTNNHYDRILDKETNSIRDEGDAVLLGNETTNESDEFEEPKLPAESPTRSETSIAIADNVGMKDMYNSEISILEDQQMPDSFNLTNLSECARNVSLPEIRIKNVNDGFSDEKNDRENSIDRIENGPEGDQASSNADSSQEERDSSINSSNPEIFSEVTDSTKYAFIDEADIDSDMEAELAEFKKITERREPILCQESRNSSPCENGGGECSNDCFSLYRERILQEARSDDCIWDVRSLTPHRFLFDFISRSLVIAVYFEANEEPSCSPGIKDIRASSLLTDRSGDVINMIHNILLMKLDWKKLKRKHRTIEDIFALLGDISKEVISTLDFMYEFEDLQDSLPIDIMENRISFHIQSYKIQLILRIIVTLRPFEDIEPNDVTVKCLLGSVKEKDIKQLMRSVKKDHRFLTHFISDVKQYVALVCEN